MDGKGAPGVMIFVTAVHKREVEGTQGGLKHLCDVIYV